MATGMPPDPTMRITVGATYHRTITWQDSNGNPVDVSGYNATLKMRKRYSTPDPPLVLLTSNPAAGLTLGGSTGVIVVRIGADVTAGLPIGDDYVWDLRLVSVADPTEAEVLAQGARAVVMASAQQQQQG